MKYIVWCCSSDYFYVFHNIIESNTSQKVSEVLTIYERGGMKMNFLGELGAFWYFVSIGETSSIECYRKFGLERENNGK